MFWFWAKCGFGRKASINNFLTNWFWSMAFAFHLVLKNAAFHHFLKLNYLSPSEGKAKSFFILILLTRKPSCRERAWPVLVGRESWRGSQDLRANSALALVRIIPSSSRTKWGTRSVLARMDGGKDCGKSTSPLNLLGCIVLCFAVLYPE